MLTDGMDSARRDVPQLMQVEKVDIDNDDDANDDIAGSAVEHPAADAHDAGGREGEVEYDLAAVTDEAAAVDGTATASATRSYTEHADTDQQERGERDRK